MCSICQNSFRLGSILSSSRHLEKMKQCQGSSQLNCLNFVEPLIFHLNQKEFVETTIFLIKRILFIHFKLFNTKLIKSQVFSLNIVDLAGIYLHTVEISICMFFCLIILRNRFASNFYEGMFLAWFKNEKLLSPSPSLSLVPIYLYSVLVTQNTKRLSHEYEFSHAHYTVHNSHIHHILSTQ